MDALPKPILLISYSESTMTLSYPFFELPDMLLALGLTLIIVMAIGSAATASLYSKSGRLPADEG